MSQAREFLSVSSEFRLGALPTECRHPLTSQLSQLAKTDLPQALDLLKRVELSALDSLRPRQSDLIHLAHEIAEVLNSGGRIFLCGCGATGRLSLAIETLWHEASVSSGRPDLTGKVISFMAGGDYALVRSIEKFEDHPEYGAQQLRDAGFNENDLLIASTEGGETPFVIGAVEEAVKLSSRKSYFHFCNPTEILREKVERSRRVIANPRIVSLCFDTGPMALAGSTRLQASTVLQLAAGAALFSFLDGKSVDERMALFQSSIANSNFAALAPMIEKESEIYAKGELCVHLTDDYGITVATDTTERTPTFSLLPFESELETTFRPSWTYLSLKQTTDSKEAWRKLLGREPRALAWPAFREKYGRESLLSFNFSRHAIERRSKLQPTRLHLFKITRGHNSVDFEFEQIKISLPRPADLLCEHLLLKCALNFSSTLVMGRLGRFEGNLMLYVRPTNNKLIDRAIRYVSELLRESGLQESKASENSDESRYEAICEQLFELLPTTKADEPIVLLTYLALRKKWEKSA